MNDSAVTGQKVANNTFQRQKKWTQPKTGVIKIINKYPKKNIIYLLLLLLYSSS